MGLSGSGSKRNMPPRALSFWSIGAVHRNHIVVYPAFPTRRTNRGSRAMPDRKREQKACSSRMPSGCTRKKSAECQGYVCDCWVSDPPACTKPESPNPTKRASTRVVVDRGSKYPLRARKLVGAEKAKRKDWCHQLPQNPATPPSYMSASEPHASGKHQGSNVGPRTRGPRRTTATSAPRLKSKFSETTVAKELRAHR